VPQLLLYAGDDAGYAQMCAALLPQLDARHDDFTANYLLRSFLVSPEPAADPAKLLAAAERRLEGGPARERFRPGEGRQRPRFDLRPEDRGPPPERGERPFRSQPGEQRRPFRPLGGPADRGPPPEDAPPPERGPPQGGPRPDGPPPPEGDGPRRMLGGPASYALGLACYRAGQHERAIEVLKSIVVEERPRHVRSIAYPVLAMAHHRLGHADEARQALAAAELAIDRWTEVMAQGEAGTMPIPWYDWIEVQLLHREATILITGSPPSDDPRLAEIEARALAALRDGSEAAAP
jgi:hypothetical protein